MKKNPLLPKTPVSAVRADTSIADCVKLLRDRSLGALVITSSDVREELVGIFTERDLVKHIELIHKGGFWENPVRSIMTAQVRTVSLERIKDAPKLMARYNIRHLPVVASEKGHIKVVGVISMRDIFRVAMERLDYDLEKVFTEETGDPPRPKSRRKLIGVFSSDKGLRQLVDQAARLTGHLIMKALAFRSDSDSLADHLRRFEALFIDIDNLSPVQLSRFLAEARGLRRNHAIFVAFNPTIASAEAKLLLHKLAEREQVHLFAKPLAFGLFYEKFIKMV